MEKDGNVLSELLKDTRKEESIYYENILIFISSQFVKYRSEKGLSQKGLAIKLGTSREKVYKIENCLHNITLKLAIEYLTKIKVPVSELFNPDILNKRVSVEVINS